MSHFVVVVLTESGLESEVYELLAEYDENLESDERVIVCECAEWNLIQAMNSKAKELGLDIPTLRNSFVPPDADDADVDKLWQAHLKPHDDFCKQFQGENKHLQVPSQDCEECHGTGYRSTTYNEQSKWDWYRVGGRWDGDLFGEERPSEDGGFNFDDSHEQMQYNTRATRELLASPKAAAHSSSGCSRP